MCAAVYIWQESHWQALVPLIPEANSREPIQPRALFNLSVGLGPSDLRFKRQQQALDQFTENHKKQLDEMPFESKTVPPPLSRQMRGIETELRRSIVAPDILGVFPTKTLAPVSAKTSLDRRLVFTDI